MGAWGWIEHDGEGYGQEVIQDHENNLRLHLSFVREGGDWVNLCRVEPLTGNYSDPASMVYYVGYNHPGHELVVDEHPERVRTLNHV